MRYTEIMFENNKTKKIKNRINKLESKGKNINNKTDLDIAKQKYVKEIVNTPEFDNIVQDISINTNTKGSLKDKESIRNIQNKINEGNIQYADLNKLQDIFDNNYKYFFTVEPHKYETDGMIQWGAIIAVVAIVMRIFYEFNDSKALLLFLIGVNIIAISYILITSPKRILKHIEAWLNQNTLNKTVFDAIVARTRKIVTNSSYIILGFIAIFLFLMNIFELASLANDIVTLISLWLSVFNDKIVEEIAKHFEWNIYHNR